MRRQSPISIPNINSNMKRNSFHNENNITFMTEIA